MNDLFHRFTDWLSYNRFAALAVLLSAALAIPACMEFKGDSPVTGRPETRIVIDKQEAEAKIAADAALKKAAKARDVAANALTQEFERRAGEINALYETTVIDTDAKAQALAASFETARTQIADQEERVAYWINAAKSVVGLVSPEFSQVATPILTLIAGGLFADNRRKDKKIAAETAKA